MKTTDEIVDRIKASDDPFGFDREVLIGYLPFKVANDAGFLRDDAEDWGDDWTEPTRENVLRDMGKYMEFAWSKALGHRGLSAGKSVVRMRAWCWLLGDEDEIDWDDYAQYGVPILKALCERYGFPVPDGEWEGKAIHRMAAGLPCEPGCEDGCGL